MGVVVADKVQVQVLLLVVVVVDDFVGNGKLMWGDYDLIFPIIDLYENNLD